MPEIRLGQATTHQIQITPVEMQEPVIQLEQVTTPEAAIQQVQVIIPPVQAAMRLRVADVKIQPQETVQEIHPEMPEEGIASEIWKTPIIIINQFS